MIVRASLVDRPSLGPSEAQIRGAIRALEAIGFIEREGEGGWQAGKPRRRPTRFVFADGCGPG